MHEVTRLWDPFLGRYVNWSTWRPEPWAVIPMYVDKFKAYRPLQQRPRDGTVVHHKTGGLKQVST